MASEDGAAVGEPPSLPVQDGVSTKQPQSSSSPVHLLAQNQLRQVSPRSSPSEESRSGGDSAGQNRPFYSSAQWTADGTSLVVGSSDQTISSFVLPSDILQSEPETGARQLEPQASVRLPEPTQVIASAPYFSLHDPATQTFLVGCRDHPLQLYHAFPNDGHPAPLCSYKLIRHETEAYITPASLIWRYPGTHFICGSANRIDCFDVSRHGSDGPVQTLATIPSKRHISKGSGVGMKGTVSALAASPVDADGGSIIAAGTWTRWMGLYDLYRTDKAVANWCISGVDTDFGTELGGQGIVQTLWSPCGRYLIINERHSSGLLVYDIRGTGQLLAILNGRKAATQQRLSCDVFQGAYGSGGFEVWAGSQDGTVSVWDGVGFQNDVAEPNWSWNGHQSPVGSTVLHSSGSVAATCSGGWAHMSTRDVEETLGGGDGTGTRSRVFQESSLNIWSITNQDQSEDDG